MFYLTTHSTHFIYGCVASDQGMFYLTTHSTHFIYGCVASDQGMFYLTTHSTHFIYGYKYWPTVSQEGRKCSF